MEGKSITGHLTQIRAWTPQSLNLTLGDFLTGDSIPLRVSQNKTKKLRREHAQEKKEETKDLGVESVSEVSKHVVKFISPVKDQIEVEDLGPEEFLETQNHSVNNDVRVNINGDSANTSGNKPQSFAGQTLVLEDSIIEQDYGMDRLLDNLQECETKVRKFIKTRQN